MSAPFPRDLARLPAPPPGLARLRARLADRAALRDALLAGLAEVPDPAGGAAGDLGGRLDVSGDPTVVAVAEAWARVADGVAAYTELTRGETYLGTAQDWTDLRRVVDLVGYRPQQRTAAHGWLRVETDPGTDPVLPRGARLQAPPVPGRPAQPFEVEEDTGLRADWRSLTVTAVPVPRVPGGRELRFLRDPGVAPPDKVLLVAETPSTPLPPPDVWWLWLDWWLQLYSLLGSPTRVLAVAGVTSRADDLGAVVVGVDRPLADLLRAPDDPATTYGMYRVRRTLTLASRLDALSYVDAHGAAQTAAVTYADPPPVDPGSAFLPARAASLVVVDGGDVSVGQRIAVFGTAGSACTVSTVATVRPLDWHVAPGTTGRMTQLGLADPLDIHLNGPVTVLLVDDRVLAQHFDLPDLLPGGRAVRIHPRPAVAPRRLAVRTSVDGAATWETVACRESEDTETPDAGDARGMLLDLAGPLTGTVSRSPATANVVPIRHGETRTAALVLDGGTAVVPGPVAGDVAADGTVTDSLVVTVDGVRFDEVPSLFGRGPAELVYATRLAADGRLVLSFGDGVTGALPRGDVTGTWRVGGGLVGEVEGAAITTVLDRVAGLRRAAGVGPTSGAADQEDQQRLRGGAAASIRALDRVVSARDVADIALTVPGTSHSVVWAGPAPDGSGPAVLRVAVLRRTSDGVRPPLPAELVALRGHLDARRDTTVPLAVHAAVASQVHLSLALDTDPRRDPVAVAAAVRAALTARDGPLGPTARALGQPLDGSDVVAVAQPVPGVLGIRSLVVSGGLLPQTPGDVSLGRYEAAPWELLAVTAADVLGTAAGSLP